MTDTFDKLKEPIKINRCHAVWYTQVTYMELVGAKDSYWLVVYTNDGNHYETEISTIVCPWTAMTVDEILERLSEATDLQAHDKRDMVRFKTGPRSYGFRPLSDKELAR